MNYYDNFYEGLNDNRNLLYRQIDTVSTMNKLLSTLYCEIYNLKNYKINVKGENSYTLKLQLKEIIECFSFYENKIQELIKMKNGFPIYQVGDIESISSIKTLASMDYKVSTILNNLINEFKMIKSLINETITNAQKENDYITITTLSDLLYQINNFLLHYEL